VEREWVQRRLQTLLDRIDPAPYAAVMLLCTGEFPGLTGPGLFLDAQHVVDHGTAALCSGVERIGVLLPLIEQSEEFHLRPDPGQELLFAHASPYRGDRFPEAARELAGTDLIVMHCMGYTEAQREIVARGSGSPVLLARRMVATALANLL
jgi:protein AroM